MQDAGIVRNRAKIEGAVRSARGLARHHGQGTGLLRACCGTSSTASRRSTTTKRRGQVPAETATSRAMSKDLAQRGFKFCGPTIVYAFMQAVGMVNDHLVGCHRHEACQKLGVARPWLTRRSVPSGRRERRPSRAPGSACCRAAGSICSIPRRSTSRSRTSRTGWRAWRAGTARPRARTSSRSPSIALLVEALARLRAPRLDRGGRLAVLLHDAPEYVIGDMISPFKAVIGDDYKAVERACSPRSICASACRRKLPADDQDADQGRRPRRRLSRSDAARRLRRGRGAAILRPAAELLRRHRARLSHALARRHRGDALSGAVRKTRGAIDAHTSAPAALHMR